jgi:hypothetical protein
MAHAPARRGDRPVTGREWLRQLLEDTSTTDVEQTYTDAALDFYLAEAGRDYAEPRQVVYRAAVLALDSMLTGAATALNFGAGAENFDMASVFDRLTRLRAIAASETTARPGVYAPSPLDV